MVMKVVEQCGSVLAANLSNSSITAAFGRNYQYFLYKTGASAALSYRGEAMVSAPCVNVVIQFCILSYSYIYL